MFSLLPSIFHQAVIFTNSSTKNIYTVSSKKSLVFKFFYFTDKLNALSEVAKIVDFGVKDGKGNNILHVLARMECSSIAFNCMKLVTKRVVIHPKMKNNSGKKPADFIRNRADERFKFLEELEKTGGKAAGYGKKKKKKKKKQKEAETGNDGEIDETQGVF